MEHLYKRRVHFADTDAAGMLHFSRLLCYAEEAEHDLLAKLNIPLMGDGGWPRVHIDCDYLAPLRVGEFVEVTISPNKIGRTSIAWDFSMKTEGNPVALVARGNMKTVRVDGHGNPTELEPQWREFLTSAS